MNYRIAMLAIGLVFGAGIGFVTAASLNSSLNGHDHGGLDGTADGEMPAKAGDAKHSHDEMISLAIGADAPTLEISVLPDPLSGWNLRLETTGFRFAPEHASLEHVVGEGHAHVYVNGAKIARLYGGWMHISSLPRGVNTIVVTLNSNDHRMLAVGHRPLRAEQLIRVE